jgi:hypothetical protein
LQQDQFQRGCVNGFTVLQTFGLAPANRVLHPGRERLALTPGGGSAFAMPMQRSLVP